MLKKLVSILLTAAMLFTAAVCVTASNLPYRDRFETAHSATAINYDWLADSWQPVGPGGGGAMYNPQCSPLDPNLVMVTCDMGGSYVSHNKGDTWNMINLNGMYNAVVYDLNDENVIYAGAYALFKSSDKGMNWTRIFPHEDRSYWLNRGYHADPFYTTLDFESYSTQDGTMDVGYGDYAYDIGYPACPPPDGYPYQGRVSALGIDPDNGNVYVTISKATGQNGGYLYKDYLFVSKNGGDSFELVAEDLTTRPSTAPYPFVWGTTTISTPLKIIVDPYSDPDDRDVFIVFNDRIFKYKTSTGDRQQISMVAPRSVTSFKSEDYILENGVITYYLCAANYIYRSNDMVNFTDIVRPNNSNVADFGPCSNDVYYARVGSAFWKTVNGGANWTQVFTGSVGSADAINPDKYTASWLEKPNNPNTGGPNNGIGWGFSNKNDIPPLNGFGVSKADGLQCYQTTDGTTYSTHDGGMVWKNNNSIPMGYIDVGSGPTMTYTTNGGNVTTTYGIHYDPFDPLHIISTITDVGMHMSFDGGQSWISYIANSNHGVPSGWRNTSYWAEFDPDVEGLVWSVWAGTHDFPNMRYMPERNNGARTGSGGVCISTNGGRQWYAVNDTAQKANASGLPTNITPTHITVGPMTETGRTLYLSTMGSGVFKSTDDGYHWVKMINGIAPIQHYYAQNKTTDGIDQRNGNPGTTNWPWPEEYSYFIWTTVWADNGTDDGVLYTTNVRSGSEFVGQAPGQIYVSYDGAESWQPITMPGDANHRVDYVNDFAVDPADSDIVYAACWQSTNGQPNYLMCDPWDARPNSGGVYKSVDGGQSWDFCWGEDRYVFSVNLDPYDSNNVFAVTFQGQLAMSNDAGATWTQLYGHDFRQSYSPFIDRNHPDFIFVTTFGGGIWRGPTGISPKLAELTVDGVALEDVGADVFSYFLEVPYEAESVVIDAKGVYHTAIITGGGEKELEIGLNAFTLTIENEIQTLCAEYTIIIERIGFIDVSDDIEIGNGQVTLCFPIRSANGKGYTVFISGDADGPFEVYGDVNFNAHGAHIKKLTNGESYFVYVEYKDGAITERSNVFEIVANKNNAGVVPPAPEPDPDPVDPDPDPIGPEPILIGAVANTSGIVFAENQKNIWDVSFTVTEQYDNGEIAVVNYTIKIDKNSSGTKSLGAYSLTYDIAGNGSNIKKFAIIF